MSDHSLYKESGVDIAKGDELVNWLKDNPDQQHSRHGQVLKGIGGFAGMFKPEFQNFKNPILVSGTDGVGTKLLLGIEQNKLTGIGEDLVAMCVNDLYCIGATPLFFLDYYATGHLDDQQFKTILTSIKSGLSKCQTALLGGETAEMPGLYDKGHFDLCGFVVGVVDESQQLGAHRVQKGDRVVALASNGFHSNGYSLVRKLLQDNPEMVEKYMSEILQPTLIYGCLPDVIAEMGVDKFHALANITGGGISGNLNRALPADLDAAIAGNKIRVPEWMSDLLASSKVKYEQVESTFNLGVGMTAIVKADEVETLITLLQKNDIVAYEIGEIVAGKGLVKYTSQIGS